MSSNMEQYKRGVHLVRFILLVITTLPLNKGNSNFSCTPSLSTPLCPGSNATCTCVEAPNNSAFVWNFTNVEGVCNGSIILSQPTLCDTLNGTCGRYLSAIVISNGTKCSNTSVLTIIADHSLDGLGITCLDMSFGQPGRVIGNTTLRMAETPGPVGNMTVTCTSVQLTVTWTPPTTGGVPTSYNVTINDSSSSVVIADNRSSVYTHTFTGLVSGTLYIVSVVAINCAGSSNGTIGTGSCIEAHVTGGSSSTSSSLIPTSTTHNPSSSPDSTNVIVGSSTISILLLVGFIACSIVLIVCCKKKTLCKPGDNGSTPNKDIISDSRGNRERRRESSWEGALEEGETSEGESRKKGDDQQGEEDVIHNHSPGLVENMRVSTSVNQLTVTWIPPTTGGVPTSYNVTINDSISPVVIADNGSSEYTHTFTGLVSNTVSIVSVMAINCAGSSKRTITHWSRTAHDSKPSIDNDGDPEEHEKQD